MKRLIAIALLIIVAVFIYDHVTHSTSPTPHGRACATACTGE